MIFCQDFILGWGEEGRGAGWGEGLFPTLRMVMLPPGCCDQIRTEFGLLPLQLLCKAYFDTPMQCFLSETSCSKGIFDEDGHGSCGVMETGGSGMMEKVDTHTHTHLHKLFVHLCEEQSEALVSTSTVIHQQEPHF